MLGKKDTLIDKFEDFIEDTWFEKPYYYCYRKVKWGWWNPTTAYYKVKYGVENLWRWFPLIWNDRNWDWHYWLVMNHKKLKSMEYDIRHNSNHLHCERDADNIQLAVLALERLMADDYHENAFINHNKKWGKLKTSWGEPDGSKCRQWLSSRDGAVTEKEKEQESKDSRRLYKHEQYMQQQDIDFACKIIAKYLFHWWD